MVMTDDPTPEIAMGIACGNAGDPGHGVPMAIVPGFVFPVTVNGELSLPEVSATVMTV